MGLSGRLKRRGVLQEAGENPTLSDGAQSPLCRREQKGELLSPTTFPFLKWLSFPTFEDALSAETY